MSEIDQQFVEYVIKSLVGKPDAVQIERRVDEKGVLLELTVDPEDLGRVIGKRGATAQSLRTLLRALGTKNGARYNLKIIDNGEPHERSSDNKDEKPAEKPPKAKSNDAEPETIISEDITKPAEEVVAKEEPEPTPPEPEEEPEEEDQTSDRLAKSRAELADLDDLDI